MPLDDYQGEDHSSLVSWGVNAKYTHHPVAAAIKYRASRYLRHLSTERICELIRKYGCTRQQPPRSYVGYVSPLDRERYEACVWLVRNEVDVQATFMRVGEYGGLSCLWCDGMIWTAPTDVDDIGDYNGRWTDDGRDFRFKKTTRRNDSGFIGMFWRESCGNHIDTLCAECHQRAASWYSYDKRRRRDGGVSYDTDALRGLLHLLKHELAKT